jgi:hypothetical protein
MDIDEETSIAGDWDTSMQLEMVVCLEGGMCSELKWCPVGAQDEVSPKLDRTAHGTAGD